MSDFILKRSFKRKIIITTLDTLRLGIISDCYIPDSLHKQLKSGKNQNYEIKTLICSFSNDQFNCFTREFRFLYWNYYVEEGFTII